MARLPQIRPSGITANPSQASASAIEGRVASSAFTQLANAASEFRRELQPVLDQRAQDRAAEDVQRAFSGREEGDLSLPDIETRLALTRQDAIYNSAVQAGFVARAQLDMEREISRLQLDNLADPVAFGEAATAFRDEYLGGTEESERPNIPPATLTSLNIAMEERIARAQTRMAEQAQLRAVGEAQESLERRLASINENISTRIAQDGAAYLDSEDYARDAAEAQDVVGLLVDHPLMGWSPERGADALDELANAGRESLLYHQVQSVYNEQGEAAALELIDEAVNGLTMDNAARIGVRSRLMGVVQTQEAISNSRRQARLLAEQERRLAAERSYSEWQASILPRLASGEVLTEEDFAAGQAHIQSGAASAASLLPFFQADPTRTAEDPQEIARLMDAARFGTMTLEELRTAGMDLAEDRAMNWSTYNQMIAMREAFDDDRLGRAFDTVDAYTAQSGLMDYDSNLPIMANEIREEVIEWSRLNPDADAGRVREYAVQLLAQRSRAIPAPAIGYIAGAPAPPPSPQSMQEVREYVEDALVFIGDSGLPESEMVRLIGQVEHYEMWAQYQLNINAAQAAGGGNAN